MFATVPLPLDHPVWVTWNQAKAYADWRGLHLPTEAQFHAASQAMPHPRKDNFGLYFTSIQSLWMLVPTAHLDRINSSATAGNGPAMSSRPSMAFEATLYIRATPPTFSTVATTS